DGLGDAHLGLMGEIRAGSRKARDYRDAPLLGKPGNGNVRRAMLRPVELERGGTMVKAYLLVIAIGLVPVALSYGANPTGMLPRLLKFNVESPNESQVFRALMCLYFATSVFWILGAFWPDWQNAALVWAAFFMLSLALGRVLSIVLDGS